MDDRERRPSRVVAGLSRSASGTNQAVIPLRPPLLGPHAGISRPPCSMRRREAVPLRRHGGCTPCRYFFLDEARYEQRALLAVGRVCGAGVLFHALRNPVDRLGEAKRERHPRRVLVLLHWWGADVVHLCPPPPRSRLYRRRGRGNLHLLSKPLPNLA